MAKTRYVCFKSRIERDKSIIANLELEILTWTVRFYIFICMIYLRWRTVYLGGLSRVRFYCDRKEIVRFMGSFQWHVTPLYRLLYDLQYDTYCNMTPQWEILRHVNGGFVTIKRQLTIPQQWLILRFRLRPYRNKSIFYIHDIMWVFSVKSIFTRPN